MTDLRKAAERALEFVDWFCGADHSVKPKNSILKTRQLLRQALAKPQTRVGEMEWQWGYERGWDAAMNQKREWVGLTDAQVEEIAEYHGIDCLYETSRIDFYRAIEAKLKEKNT
jgi:hypothetical protein